METYFKAEEAAQIAKVTPETIRRCARKGTLRSVKVGRLLRIPESALRDYMGDYTNSASEEKATS